MCALLFLQMLQKDDLTVEVTIMNTSEFNGYKTVITNYNFRHIDLKDISSLGLF